MVGLVTLSAWSPESTRMRAISPVQLVALSPLRVQPAPVWTPEPAYGPLGRSVTRRTDAEGRVIARLSVVPVVAVTTSVVPEMPTEAVRTVKLWVARVESGLPAGSVARTEKV